MDKLLTVRDACALLCVSYPTIYRWLRDGRFPEPVNGRGRKLLWTQATIEQWMNQKSTSGNTTSPSFSIPVRQKQEKKTMQHRSEVAQSVLAKHAMGRRKPK